MEWQYWWDDYNFGGNILDRRSRTVRVVAKKVIKPFFSTPRNNTVKPLALRKLDGSDDARPVHTDRGHLIGLQFGGPEESWNLVPMYAGFNGQGGAWGQLETNLASHLGTKGRSVNIDIRVTYGNANSAVPTAFTVKVTANSMHALPGNLTGTKLIQMPVPVNYYQAPDADQTAFAAVLKKHQDAMEKAEWYVEQSQPNSPGVWGAPLAVGEEHLTPGAVNFKKKKEKKAFYDSRPYAVLDWMWFNHQNEYFLCDGPNLSGGIQNTTFFSSAQVDFICKAAFARHGGFIHSDLYGVHVVEDQLRLMLGSTDYQGQVDHIHGKASGGSNAYSNARIISGKMNKALNGLMVREAVSTAWKNKAGL